MRAGMKKLTLCLTLLAGASCGKGANTSASTREAVKPLVAVCEADASQAKPWLCGEELSFECGEQPAEIAVPQAKGCELPYTVSPKGPYGVGSQTLTVKKGDRLVCESKIVVTDTKPPVATDKRSELWPPNHKAKSFSVTDCADVFDRCSGEVRTYFRWVASNESPNAKGDGNTSDDISVTCDSISLRAERSGGGAGRIYRAGITAIDPSGNRTDAECTIIVPHDQGKKNTTSTFVEAYRVAAPTGCEEKAE